MNLPNTPQLAEMLRQHHAGTPSKPVPGLFIQEIQAPHHSRRADALWLPLMTGMRGQIWGYELKVSRADLMHELADPTKADPWMRYCDQWTLVLADESLMKGLEIPELWGILVPSGRRVMRTVRKPSPLRPDAQRDAYGTILARVYFGGEDGDTRLQRAEEAVARYKEGERSYLEQIADLRVSLGAAGQTPALQERIGKVVAAVERMAHDYRAPEYINDRNIAPELIAEAVVNLERVRHRATSLQKAADEVARQVAVQLRGMGDRVDEHRGRLRELVDPLTRALDEEQSA